MINYNVNSSESQNLSALQQDFEQYEKLFLNINKPNQELYKLYKPNQELYVEENLIIIQNETIKYMESSDKSNKEKFYLIFIKAGNIIKDLSYKFPESKKFIQENYNKFPELVKYIAANAFPVLDKIITKENS
jgi:hypothetical protein